MTRRTADQWQVERLKAELAELRQENDRLVLANNGLLARIQTEREKQGRVDVLQITNHRLEETTK